MLSGSNLALKNDMSKFMGLLDDLGVLSISEMIGSDPFHDTFTHKMAKIKLAPQVGLRGSWCAAGVTCFVSSVDR